MRNSIFKYPIALSLFLPLSLVADCCCDDWEEELPCDFECFTAPYLSSKTTWVIGGDYLYWYSKEKNLAYAMEATVKNIGDEDIPQIAYGPTSYHDLDESWNSGYRIMGAFTPGCDGWDFTAIWTSYNNKNSELTSVTPSLESIPSAPGDQLLFNPWISGSVISNEGATQTFDAIKAQWKLRFSQIDGELGRKYWLSRGFSLRPYMGVRAVWIKGDLDLTSTKTTQFSPTIFQDNFSSRAKGVGLLAGLQPNWHFTPNFSLFANMEGSLLWGKTRTKKTQDYFSNDVNFLTLDIETTSEAEFFQMLASLDLNIGFRWETCFCEDRFRWSIDIGWENHYWFDTFYRNKARGSFFTAPSSVNPPTVKGFTSYDQVASDLILAGGFARIRFDF